MILFSSNGAGRVVRAWMAGAWVCGAVGTVAAQDKATVVAPTAVEQELQFARDLSSSVWGMPDLATYVLERLETQGVASAKEALEDIRVDVLASQGKFDDIKVLIEKLPDKTGEKAVNWTLKLGTTYYTFGKYKEAQTIFSDFIGRYATNAPPENLNDTYLKAAFSYGQMLLLIGKEKEAISAFEAALKAKMSSYFRRQILTAIGELIIQQAAKVSGPEQAGLLARASKLIEELQWDNSDEFFGKTLVMMATIKYIQNDVDGAVYIISEYKDTLERIDESLKAERRESQSPMAQCRYVIGSIMLKQAEKLKAQKADKARVLELLSDRKTPAGVREGAVRHLVTVIYNYPGSPWAPECQILLKSAEKLVVELGGSMKIDVPVEKQNVLKKAQLQEAKILLNQGDYENAAARYSSFVNAYPDTAEAVVGIGELIRCYAEMQSLDEASGFGLYAEALTRHLAERYGADGSLMEGAGNVLLSVADVAYADAKHKKEMDQAYTLFYTYFTRHPRQAVMLFRTGELRFQNKDYEGALGCFKQITENYTNSILAIRALSRTAACYGALGNRNAEVKLLIQCTNQLARQVPADRPGHVMLDSEFRLGVAYKGLGEDRKSGDKAASYLTAAVGRLAAIIQKLTTEPDKYQQTPRETDANVRMLAEARYQRAAALAQINAPADKVAGFKQEAIKGFIEFVELYPENIRRSPSALNRAAAVQMSIGQAAAAKATLGRLQASYKDSPEAQDAQFQLGMALIELNMKKEAAQAFLDMLDGQPQYDERKTQQLLVAGEALIGLGDFDAALRAYDKVAGGAKDNRWKEAAQMGRAKVLMGQKKFGEAAASLEDFNKAAPRSAQTIDVLFLLSTCHSELGKTEQDPVKRNALYNKAVDAINRARAFAKQRKDSPEADDYKLGLEVARIFVRLSEAEEKFGRSKESSEGLGTALSAYQAMLFKEAKSPEAQSFAQDGFGEFIPLLVKKEEWTLVVTNADRYLKLFPNGRYVSSVRQWKSQASVKLVATGAGS